MTARPLDLTNADERLRGRFWSKVDRRGPDECWPWLAHCKKRGYGQFTLTKGQFFSASRIALALTIGRALEPNEVACHRCDNPPCVNPAHLFAGTQRDNALDSVQKGRARRLSGSAHPVAVLTEEQVREIRAVEERHGVSLALARQYGVNPNHVRSIRNGTKWKHSFDPEVYLNSNRVEYCRSGLHPFTEENTYRRPNGGRMCRACSQTREEKRPPRSRRRAA